VGKMMRALLCFFPLLVGCAASSEVAADESDLGSDPSIPRLPEAGGTGALAPWGGQDASRWRPEAILANAASRAMNEGWSRADVKDVVVAIPVKLHSSGFFEFGDGQANAKPEFEAWRGTSRPPVVASVIQFKNAPARLVLRFDRGLPFAGSTFEMRVRTTTIALGATRDAAGDAVVDVPLPDGLSWSDLLSPQAALVRPKGWADWFPLYFRTGVKKISELRASRATFADGRSIVDRERVSSAGATDGRTVLDRLQRHSFGVGYNGASGASVNPYTPASIHATYPVTRGLDITTGVGRGFTWVADERPNGFKVMYTCFEKRRADLEASAPNGGVASGGGWHQINDAAETILNDLETGPLMVAAGRNNPWLETKLPGGTFSYGLSDVATFRWLRPGEAFITTKGNWVEDAGRWFEQSNYHWYFFAQDKDVCTEELVNPPGQIPQDFDL
jgi:hypothetical protein